MHAVRQVPPPSRPRPPAFLVDATAGVATSVSEDPRARALVTRYREALGVAGERPFADPEADREDWTEQAFRVVGCLEAADPHGYPVWAVRDGGLRLVPLNDAAVGSDPDARSLVLWGLRGASTLHALARRGLEASDPFGGSPAYWRSPAFVANAGRRFTTCRADEDPSSGDADLPCVRDVLRREAGNEVVHKVLGGTLKEYPVTRFVPDEAGSMPEDVAWCLLHRAGDEHSVQEAVDMAYEYRLMVVDGTVVTGAGSVMEHTPLDRLPGDGTYSAMARRNVRGHDVPCRQVEVDAYRRVGQSLVDAILLDGGIARHFVMDLYTTDRGDVGIVELNPLGGSGFFANDALAVARAVVDHVAAHAPEPGGDHAPTPA